MQASRTDGPDLEREDSLYFFPDSPLTATQLRQLLADAPLERRAWAISHLLRYAEWDDIWKYVNRDEIREVFADLDLPAGLRAAWARMLKIEEVPTGER